jgi:hypothetical protein
MLLIVFAAMVAGNTHARSKEPKREVLFTLAENEVIVHDEYALGVALKGYKFAAVVKNTRTSKFTLVFNGKRVYETKSLPRKGNESAYWFDENELPHSSPLNAFNVLFINPAVENGYAYWYTLAGRRFFNVMGKVTSGAPDWGGGASFSDNGKFAFGYYENDENHYNVNGEDVPKGEFDIAWAEMQEESSRPGFHLPRYKIINDIKSNDGKHMFYSDWEYAYVVIDGQEVGEHPALYAYYDERKNAFIWNSIEGKELVVYEYKL